jgi:outer membrane protein OmpA-like peptidoglycan-associated protein
MRQTVQSAALLILLSAAGCGARRGDLIVLVPDPETGKVGQAVVSAGGGSVTLATAGEGTMVVPGRAPAAPAPVPPDRLERVFGAAIRANPQPARTFLLYFGTGSDQLTPESQAQVPDIVAAVRSMPVPEVSVIGHTDTQGDAGQNVTLGLRRAAIIRDLLVSAGIDSSRIEVASHGEADPLVPTPDNTAEPRNRRVEVTVR